MRRAALTVILALGLTTLTGSLPFATPASAEVVAPAPTLVLEPPTRLHARVQHARRMHLLCGTQKACSSLSLAPAWSALFPTRATLGQNSAANSSRGARARVLRPPRGVAFGVGKRVALKSGREVSMQLTPTPARCAPLFKVTY